MQCVDFSFFWIMNEERIIPGHLIRLILQRIGNPGEVLRKIQFEVDNFFDAPLTKAGDFMRFVKILEITYLLVFCHILIFGRQGEPLPCTETGSP